MKKKDFTISRRDPQKEEQLAKEFRKKMRNLLNFIKSSPDWAFRYDLFKAAESETVEESTEKTKGLSADQVRYLQDSIQMSQQTMLNMMIQALTDSNDKLQGWLDEGVGILNFDGVQIDASKFALPEVATNSEDAAKAVADGGDWSVDAVATRIFDLATAIAGNDPDKLATMRSAVEEGFSQAGVTWSNATGLDKMPEITQNTYDEIMSRFDKLNEELSGSV